MKLFKYIWRNATRNKIRTLLTVLSVGFSLALMTVLYGYLSMQSVWSKEAKTHNRVVVLDTQGLAGKVPIAYVDRVRQTEGVKAAVPYQWFGGMYKDDKMSFAQFGTDANQVFDVWTEIKIAPEQLEAWKKNRQGCVVDREMAEHRKWKIGERSPLKGTYYPFNLELEMVGTFEAPHPTESLWYHWEYLDEGLKGSGGGAQAGNAGTIFAKTESAAAIPAVCQAIDDRFGSSDNPTRTQTEEAFAQMFSDMLGNVQAYIRNIGLAVMFSLTLVSGNAMAMAMRERTTEVAVLKAIGFRRTRVLNMVLGESCLIAAVGGLFGLAAGGLLLELMHRASRNSCRSELPTWQVPGCLALLLPPCSSV